MHHRCAPTDPLPHIDCAWPQLQREELVQAGSPVTVPQQGARKKCMLRRVRNILVARSTLGQKHPTLQCLEPPLDQYIIDSVQTGVAAAFIPRHTVGGSPHALCADSSPQTDRPSFCVHPRLGTECCEEAVDSDIGALRANRVVKFPRT